jgi:DNA polymerase III alpha subunit
MCFINIKDNTKQAKITYWPGVYQKIKDKLIVGKIFKLEIEINERGIIGTSDIEILN